MHEYIYISLICGVFESEYRERFALSVCVGDASLFRSESKIVGAGKKLFPRAQSNVLQRQRRRQQRRQQRCVAADWAYVLNMHLFYFLQLAVSVCVSSEFAFHGQQQDPQEQHDPQHPHAEDGVGERVGRGALHLFI